MPRASISSQTVEQIRRQIEAEGHGARRMVAEAWAEKLGVSVATIYRKIKITAGEKKVKREVSIPTAIIIKIGQMKAESALRGRKGRMLRTEDCIRILEQSGTIEPGTVSRSTIDRRLREMGWNAERQYTRHEPDYVNQIHIYDFSVSDYVSVAGRIGPHDWNLKLEKSGFSSYKNKAETGNMKLWLCSMMDTYSRVPIMQYRVSPGESLEMMASFMNYVYSRQDSLLPVPFLPDELHLDQGAIGKSKDFSKRLKDMLDIRVQLSASKSDRHAQHQSGGKIERQFRTYWQTENYFSYVMDKKGISEVSLSALNALLRDECIRIAQRIHPTRREISRMEAYQQGVQRRVQLVNSGELSKGNEVFKGDFFNILYKDIERVVDASGLISLDNVYYEIQDKRFINTKIRVVIDQHGDMMGESADRVTGELFQFRIWKYDPDVAQPKKPAKHLRQQLAQRNDLDVDFSGVSLQRSAEKPEEESNVISMPAKQSDKVADTPFSQRPIDVMMSYDDAREYIVELTGLPWNEIPTRIKSLLQIALEAKALDEATLQDIASLVS